jgi:hypothetical protein
MTMATPQQRIRAGGRKNAKPVLAHSTRLQFKPLKGIRSMILHKRKFTAVVATGTA